MNPLLFKAHPLLQRTLETLLAPEKFTASQILGLILLYLILNLPWALVWYYALYKIEGLRLPLWLAYLFALPSLLGYLPIQLTLTGDVMDHNFNLADRVIFLFVLFVAVQMLGVFYGFLVRYARSAYPIGLHAGMSLALSMLLMGLPYSMLLLTWDGWFR